MVSPRSRWFVLSGLLLGATVLGCQTPGTQFPGPGVPAARTASPPLGSIAPLQSHAPPKQKELPPDEAARVAYTTAEALERSGKNGEAIALYEQARHLDGRFAPVSRRLGVLYDREGNYSQAQKEYAEALKRSPKDATLLNDIGYSHYRAGKWADAEEALRQAVTLDPKLERAWINLGLSLAHQGHYDIAAEAFQRVISEGEAYANLAFVLTAQGKREEAKEMYRKALALEPRMELAKTALFKLEHPEEAAQQQEAAKKKKPTSDRGWVSASDLLMQQSIKSAAPTPFPGVGGSPPVVAQPGPAVGGDGVNATPTVVQAGGQGL